MSEDTIYKIDLEPVSSSHIGAAGYDARTNVLAVQFSKTGVIWHYAGVDANLAFDFYTADSKGKFYSDRIKGKFPGERMTGPCSKCGIEGYGGETCSDCGTAVHVVPPRRDVTE